MPEGRYLTFRCGADRMALQVDEVLEIIRPPRLTRVPHAPGALLGVANLRGSVLPIVALDRLLGRDRGPETPSSRVLVLNRATPLGLLVDEVATLGEKAGQSGTLDLEPLLEKSFATTARTAKAAGAPVAEQPETAPSTGGEVAVIAFLLAGQSYALRLAHAREVLLLPPANAVSAGGGAVSLGVMAWRDLLLPLISLRAVLGRPQAQDNAKARVVVASTDLGFIGLVTDGMCEVLRLPATQIDPVPVALARSHGRTEIEAIARMDGGQRLISILSAETFFTARRLADTSWAAAPKQDQQMTDEAQDIGQTQQQVVVFTLGDEQYGLPIAAVQEIVRLPETLARLPRAPDFIDGVMNLRGAVLPVIDQARRFGVPLRKQAGSRRVMVISLTGVQVGFAVDKVREIMNVMPSDVSDVPDFGGDGTKLFDRAVRRSADDTVILVVDPQELLDRTERDLLAALSPSSNETA